MMKDIILFLAYNDKKARRMMSTDYYTESNIESLIYNCEKLKENHLNNLKESEKGGGEC